MRSGRSLLSEPAIDIALRAAVKKNAHKLDSIHPLPPAELPNFLYNLPGSLPPSVPSSIVKEKTLGFADAGVELNIPYVPLMRRSVDVIIALDASADNHETWFARAAEYAKQYSEKAQSRFAWPEVDVKAIFPGAEEGEMKEKEKSRDDAATKVDQAKAQERVTASKTAHEREGVETKNPEPVPTGSAPQSREAATKGKVDEKGVPVEADDKPMPESQGAKEPPLGKCRCIRLASSLSHTQLTVFLQHLDRFDLAVASSDLPQRQSDSRRRPCARRNRARLHPAFSRRDVPQPARGVLDMEV